MRTLSLILAALTAYAQSGGPCASGPVSHEAVLTLGANGTPDQLAQRVESCGVQPGWNAELQAELRGAIRGNPNYANQALRDELLALVLLKVRPPEPAGGAGPLPVKRNPHDGLEYVRLPAGTFLMGCSPGDDECDQDEKPQKQQSIPRELWIGKTEVTQRAYARVVRNNPSSFKGENLPVETVGYAEAQAYCEAIGGRLPTEIEWEYAARAGVNKARHGILFRIAWVDTNSGNKTHPAGELEPNAWGLHDMLGNVWEWTSTVSGGGSRIVRGGSWFGNPRLARASLRSFRVDAVRLYCQGFRCLWESVAP